MALKNVMHVEDGNVYGSTPNSDNMISDAYNPENVYDAGDICIYGNTLYKCNTDDTTGVWNAAKWSKTTVAGELRKEITTETEILRLNGDGVQHNSGYNLTSNEIEIESGLYTVESLLRNATSCVMIGYLKSANEIDFYHTATQDGITPSNLVSDCRNKTTLFLPKGQYKFILTQSGTSAVYANSNRMVLRKLS